MNGDTDSNFNNNNNISSSTFPNLKKIKFINDVRIHNEIQNNRRILVFDLREPKEFQNNCLPNSLNIPYSDYEFNFFKNFTEKVSNFEFKSEESELKEMIKRYKRFYITIIFDEKKYHRKEILNFKEEDFKKEESLYKAILLYNSLVGNKVREIGIFIKGFEKLKEKFWFILKDKCDTFEMRQYDFIVILYVLFLFNFKKIFYFNY